MDPKHFPQPDQFQPERFSPENKARITQGTYLAWGSGPRLCLGMKISKLESKALIYEILRSFEVEPCSKTSVPIKWSKVHVNRLEEGTWVTLKPRESFGI